MRWPCWDAKAEKCPGEVACGGRAGPQSVGCPPAVRAWETETRGPREGAGARVLGAVLAAPAGGPAQVRSWGAGAPAAGRTREGGGALGFSCKVETEPPPFEPTPLSGIACAGNPAFVPEHKRSLVAHGVSRGDRAPCCFPGPFEMTFSSS